MTSSARDLAAAAAKVPVWSLLLMGGAALAVSVAQLPHNILATAGAPIVDRLQELGVARVSLGSGPMRATLGLLRRLAEELRQGLDFVARLDPLHVVDVAGIEELGPDEQKRELRLGAYHRSYVRRFCAVPVRPGKQEAAGAVAG